MRFLSEMIDHVTGAVTRLLLGLHALAGGWGLGLFLLAFVVWALPWLPGRLLLGLFGGGELEEKLAEFRRSWQGALTQRYYEDERELRLKYERREWLDGALRIAAAFELLVPALAYLGILLAFSRSAALRGASLLWVPDLSAPDPLRILPLGLLALGCLGTWAVARQPRRRGLALPAALSGVLLGGLGFVLPAAPYMFFLVSKVHALALRASLVLYFSVAQKRS